MELKPIQPTIKKYLATYKRVGEGMCYTPSETIEVVDLDLTKIEVPEDTVKMCYFEKIEVATEVDGKKIKCEFEERFNCTEFACWGGKVNPDHIELGMVIKVPGPKNFPCDVWKINEPL